jgi:hypothetical protein
MDLCQVREVARTASVEFLLDRVTIFRGEIEGPAIEVFEAELRARGIQQAQMDAHAAERASGGLMFHPDRTVVRCAYCARPATVREWRWQRLWGWFLPLFPRRFYLCREHAERLPTDTHGRPLHFDPDPGQPGGTG